jgi:hypothetical protein
MFITLLSLRIDKPYSNSGLGDLAGMGLAASCCGFCPKFSQSHSNRNKGTPNSSLPTSSALALPPNVYKGKSENANNNKW